MTMPSVGQPAPEVTFRNANRETVSSAELKGKENLVIAFYVAAFTGGWERELREFERLNADFQRLNTQVWGVSVDMAPTQRAFGEHCGLGFQMVSGFPNHDGAKALGAYNEERSITRRVTYVIDKNGILQHMVDDPGDMERHPREALEAITRIEGS